MKMSLGDFINKGIIKGIILLFLGMSVAPFAAKAELPAKFIKEEIEANVIRKFISLQSEYDDFYKVTSIETTEVIDHYYGLPGYVVQINYSTQKCPNNYFKGLAYSAMCTAEECPFGMVYKKCF